MQKLVKAIKLNNLQYNANRDPQAYRRCVDETFRIQAVLQGSGTATCALMDAAGHRLAEGALALPGTFSATVSFPTPGARVVTLDIAADGERVCENLLLDVMEHPWAG
ncbi:MAG: hypothetical protein M0T84_03985 [Betaproteobacteria bacterium]|nr:hypothetical protein [Betaproteobacteria bacterium]